MSSSCFLSMRNGPAMAAPVCISIATTTPPSSNGFTIQLNPLRNTGVSLELGILRVVNRTEHRLEQHRHVVVGPCGRIGCDFGNDLRLREIGTAKPHVYLEFHLPAFLTQRHRDTENVFLQERNFMRTEISVPLCLCVVFFYWASIVRARRSASPAASVVGSVHVKS